MPRSQDFGIKVKFIDNSEDFYVYYLNPNYMICYFVFCVFRTLSLTFLAPRKGVPMSIADLERFLIGCSQLEVIICYFIVSLFPCKFQIDYIL